METDLLDHPVEDALVHDGELRRGPDPPLQPVGVWLESLAGAQDLGGIRAAWGVGAEQDGAGVSPVTMRESVPVPSLFLATQV